MSSPLNSVIAFFYPLLVSPYILFYAPLHNIIMVLQVLCKTSAPQSPFVQYAIYRVVGFCFNFCYALYVSWRVLYFLSWLQARPSGHHSVASLMFCSLPYDNMVSSHQHVLRECRPYLLERLSLSDLQDHLIQDNVIPETVMRTIMVCLVQFLFNSVINQTLYMSVYKTIFWESFSNCFQADRHPSSQIRALLDWLSGGSPEAYRRFLLALRSTCQGRIQEYLECVEHQLHSDGTTASSTTSSIVIVIYVNPFRRVWQSIHFLITLRVVPQGTLVLFNGLPHLSASKKAAKVIQIAAQSWFTFHVSYTVLLSQSALIMYE